jgi:hypothetical protein
MRRRTAGGLAIAAITAALTLTACGPSGGSAAPPPQSGPSATAGTGSQLTQQQVEQKVGAAESADAASSSDAATDPK